MINALLNKLIARCHLTQQEAAELLEHLISDRITEPEIAAVLVALASKGETEEELAGFAEAMRNRCIPVAANGRERWIDTCGTGGSRAKTFNVSTAAALVVAGAGVPVAKHGNVGVTSKVGSADVLKALGIKADLEPQRAAQCFNEVGICFMFAPLHHAATKRVAQVRRALGVRTIFNLLGPLTNPARAPFQVAGVSDEAAAEKVAGALVRLGTRRAWVVRGTDGLDEITLSGPTAVVEATPAGLRRFEIAPEDFGLSRSAVESLRGASPEENAETIVAVLSGLRRDAAFDLVSINAAAALFVSEECDSLREAAELAERVIDSGAAMAKLDALRRFSDIVPQAV
jgi:anthranilate phosphoribosyltransferase